MLPDHCRFFTQSGSPSLRPRYLCTKTTIGFRQQMDHTVPPKEYTWKPGHLINENFRLGDNGHVCMVLNRQINVPPHVVKLLWKNGKPRHDINKNFETTDRNQLEFFQSATIRCAIDGGSNRWRSFMMSQATGKQIKDEKETNKDDEKTDMIEPPDLITGDFDSITQETVEFFKTIPKINTPDQDATDFTKAFAVMQPVMEQRKLHDVVVFTECSGRLDQTMANLNTLYKMQKEKCNVYLVSGDSITWLLRPGKHTIQIPLDLVTEQRWCSLMPLGSPAHNVTTTGLKWNLCKCCLHKIFKYSILIGSSYPSRSCTNGVRWYGQYIKLLFNRVCTDSNG